MAPRRKSRTITATEPADSASFAATTSQSREYKIRLPEDVAQRIEAKAKAEGRPQNRVIINELASFPDLRDTHSLEVLRGRYEVLLAKYSARISLAYLSDELLHAVDAVLEAKNESDLRAQVERMRITRVGILEIQKEAKRWE